MTPLPKRRNSTRRGGKRERANLAKILPTLNVCPKCSSNKLPHRVCAKCGHYK